MKNTEQTRRLATAKRSRDSNHATHILAQYVAPPPAPLGRGVVDRVKTFPLIYLMTMQNLIALCGHM